MMPDIKKNIKYQKEQQQVLEKILHILNFNKDYVFYLYELDNNEQIQNVVKKKILIILKKQILMILNIKSLFVQTLE